MDFVKLLSATPSTSTVTLELVQDPWDTEVDWTVPRTIHKLFIVQLETDTSSTAFRVAFKPDMTTEFDVSRQYWCVPAGRSLILDNICLRKGHKVYISIATAALTSNFTIHYW